MSYAKNLFEGVPKKQVNKSRFNLSHEWKGNINMGKIIPILCEPTLPNDEFQFSGTEFMFRFPPLLYPLMQMCSMFCNFFYVPNRILWRETTHTPNPNGWKGFITMGDIDGDVEDHPVCVVDNQYDDTTPSRNDTVLGFMGFPYYRSAVGWEDVITNINCFPLSAYLAIWDEYYRNAQIEPGRWFNLQPGDNTTAFDTAFDQPGLLPPPGIGRYRVLSSKWEKDYFTSALPQPQIGEPIQVPLINEDGDLPGQMIKLSDGTPAAAGTVATSGTGDLTNGIGGTPIGLDIQETAASIRQLRFAEAMQQFKERVLKIGQRYTDFLKGLWGNNIQPGEAQVPVWFGYYRGKIQITDVQTTATTDAGGATYTTGQYTGRADLYEKSDKFNVFCSEHGWIIALMELKPNTGYGQGLPRWFRYQLPTDYPLDIFANIGDQEILKEEILLWTKNAENAINQETFGYIPRYSEYRYRNNLWIGALGRPTGIGIHQHLGRIWDVDQMDGNMGDLVINPLFTNLINEDFNHAVKGGLREDNVFTVLPTQIGDTSENTVFCHIFHSIYVNRELPMFSTPKLG